MGHVLGTHVGGDSKLPVHGVQTADKQIWGDCCAWKRACILDMQTGTFAGLCYASAHCERLHPSAHETAAQGIEGVRFKRLIMDESASDRSPHPPEDASKKRLIFCTGKVQPLALGQLL